MLAKVSKISTAVMLGTMMLAGAAGNAMAADNKTVLTLVAQQELQPLPASGSVAHHPSLHL